MAGNGQRDEATCSFCGKAQHQVLSLVSGPDVYICDECIELCAELVDTPAGPSEGTATAGAAAGTRTTGRGWVATTAETPVHEVLKVLSAQVAQLARRLAERAVSQGR